MVGSVPLPVGVLYVCVRVVELCLAAGSGYVQWYGVPLSIGMSYVCVRVIELCLTADSE
jgi:hypothetical protein